MKHLEVYEGFINRWMTKYNIKSTCRKYSIRNYTINDDMTIDVEGNVVFTDYIGEYLPLYFRNISGDFSLYSTYFLKSLKGFPEYVGGSVDLIGSLKNVTSLKGLPKVVKNTLNISSNGLTSLEGITTEYCDDFYMSGNKIKTFENFPKEIGYLYCNDNPIKELWELIYKDCPYNEINYRIELFNDYDIIRPGDKIVLDRLNEFLRDIDQPIIEARNMYFRNYIPIFYQL